MLLSEVVRWAEAVFLNSFSWNFHTGNYFLIDLNKCGFTFLSPVLPLNNEIMNHLNALCSFNFFDEMLEFPYHPIIAVISSR